MSAVDLKLQWLEYFVVLAETRSFRVAAHKLFITQQTLSHNLNRLEETLGVLLIDRHKRFEQLTPEGQSFYERALELLKSAYELEQPAVRLEVEHLRGDFRLGDALLWPDASLYQALSCLVTQCPALKLFLCSPQSQAQLEQELLAGTLQLGFSHQLPRSPELRAWLWYESRCMIVTPPQDKRAWHELTYIQLLNPDSAAAEDLFWPETLHRRKISVSTAHVRLALALCRQGLGALFIPHKLAEAEIAREELVRTASPPLDRRSPVYLIWNAARPLNPVATLLIEHLQTGHPLLLQVIESE